MLQVCNCNILIDQLEQDKDQASSSGQLSGSDLLSRTKHQVD